MRIIIKFTGLLAFVSTFGMAQSLQSDLLDCAQNSDSLQRLVCYDNLAKNNQLKTVHKQNKSTKNPKIAATPSPVVLEQKAALPPTQLITERPIEPDLSKSKPTVNAAADFGQEHKNSSKDWIDQIQGKILKVRKSAYGDQIITLDNGQVWRQTDSTRLKLAEGQSVTIKRGALGSFFISKENTNRRIRAKRVN